jgi:site-specific recombinase XerD
LHAVRRFLKWTEGQDLTLLHVTPGMVGRYFDALTLSPPSKKLHLAAIRAFFDVLVTRHVVVLNPALSVKTERYSVMEGKTPEITVDECRQLLKSIEPKSVVDLRDRALIGMLIYTAARAGAVAKLKLKDLPPDRSYLLLSEKGGKARAIPVRDDLGKWLEAYIFVAGIESESIDSPLFRTAAGGSMCLGTGPMSGVDVCRMVKRRLKAAGLSTLISPHSFRSCTATDLLLQGVALEDVQYLLGHSDSRVTKLYDRRRRQVTRNIVERISV